MVALFTCKACVQFEMVLTSPSAQHVMPSLGGTRPAYLHIHQQRQHKGEREHAEGSDQGNLQAAILSAVNRGCSCTHSPLQSFSAMSDRQGLQSRRRTAAGLP